MLKRSIFDFIKSALVELNPLENLIQNCHFFASQSADVALKGFWSELGLLEIGSLLHVVKYLELHVNFFQIVNQVVRWNTLVEVNINILLLEQAWLFDHWLETFSESSKQIADYKSPNQVKQQQKCIDRHKD